MQVQFVQDVFRYSIQYRIASHIYIADNINTPMIAHHGSVHNLLQIAAI